MPTLTDKLKALGVKLGASEINAGFPKKQETRKESFLNSTWLTYNGSVNYQDTHYSFEQFNTIFQQENNFSLGFFSELLREPRLIQYGPEQITFIDTETTGLSGGSGTLAFIIGVGRIEDQKFHLVQFFLDEPSNELNLLIALEEFLASSKVLVSFNGKSFDIPILKNRYILNGQPNPFLKLQHIDLLPVARRLWRERLQSRTLGNLEFEILQISRKQDDIPGWMIPQMYFDFLHEGDFAPMERVLYHNAMDVLSLSNLLTEIILMTKDPISSGSINPIDLFSLARIYEELGRLEVAINYYSYGLDFERNREFGLPESLVKESILRLAEIYKKMGDIDRSLSLWQRAVELKEITGFIEMAKIYEHKYKNPQEAKTLTISAIDLLETSDLSVLEQLRWHSELKHRLERLERKINAGL